MTHDDLDCTRAKEQLSARLDGELLESGALRAHLASCADCHAYERALAGLAGSFAGLRRGAPLADLWPRIERRARPRPALGARLAAAVVGFAGLGGAFLLVERAAPAGARTHALERLAAAAPTPDALFSALPEYRLLRALPAREETR